MSVSVIADLLTAMSNTVTDYGVLKRTNDSLETIIQGTSFFPGGSGLWRGERPFGALPEAFPERPVMFLAHNFDKDTSYRDSLRRGIESMSDLFWIYLRAYLREAGIAERQCFFTNALMGLQPVKATGPMDASPLFRKQCRELLQEQMNIVQPCCIAILGNDAAEEIMHVDVQIPRDTLHHPSWLKYRKKEERAAIISEQAAKLKCLWDSAQT